MPIYNQFKWQLLVFITFAITTFYAIDFEWHYKFLIEFVKLNLIIFCFYFIVLKYSELKNMIWAYLFGCAYIGYEAYLVGRNSQGRVEGIGTADSPDGNDTAALLAPASGMIFYFLWRGNRYEKIAAVVFGVLIVNGLILINSRGAFLGFIGTGVLYVFSILFTKGSKNTKRASAIAFIIISLAGAVYLTDDSFWNRFDTIKNESERGSEGGGRVEFWLLTFDMIKDRPWGLGAYGYQILSPLYLDASKLAGGGINMRAVHSTWFQALSEIGWLGFFFFIMMIRSIIRNFNQVIVKLNQQLLEDEAFFVRAIKYGFIGYLISITFIDRFRSELLYWFLLFSAIAYKLFILQKYENHGKASQTEIEPVSNHMGP